MPRVSLVRKIGSSARRIIVEGSTASVLGITSRGAFLFVDPAHVVFLSAETYPGPLVLNLSEKLEALAVGDRVRILSGVLWFEKTGFCIDTNPAEVWQPSERPLYYLSHQDRRTLLRQIGSGFSRSQFWQSARLPDLLPALIDVPATEAGRDSVLQATYKRLWDAWAGARHGPALSQSLQYALLDLLGMGSGLTPSGDDVLVGLLLALNRWGDVLAPGFPVQTLDEMILDAAPGATTALSVSILQCAAEGQSSESLVEALDGLVTGQPGWEGIVERLRTYGASSGLDTLAGFAIACR